MKLEEFERFEIKEEIISFKDEIFPSCTINLHKNDIMIEITGIQEKNSYMGCKKMDDFFYIIDQIMVLRPKVNRIHVL